ncbi:hypothetical protein HUK65_02675 [Rhodobacteraceae bacterium 2376]|uniref:Uncharacterized protein n=1 Tax=Rhabdonatronobacter sediminivivens TaxID=2743469 RepID=A0A7Z0HX20_9RHOB|nr:hypothetical protein [Rhabdonatronobacter sediminivivens]NYS23881.1 hypothetical protein [Rhabdonatronobacter sediminivivens]
MTRRPEPLFLARETFRRRRLMDAARVLPFAGLFLVLLPMLWPVPVGEAPNAAREGVYLFVVWLALVVAAWALSRRLVAVMEPDPADDGKEL